MLNLTYSKPSMFRTKRLHALLSNLLFVEWTLVISSNSEPSASTVVVSCSFVFSKITPTCFALSLESFHSSPTCFAHIYCDHIFLVFVNFIVAWSFSIELGGKLIIIHYLLVWQIMCGWKMCDCGSWGRVISNFPTSFSNWSIGLL